MTHTLMDVISDIHYRIAELVGIQKEKTWDDIKDHVKEFRNIPLWASDTIISILGNMQDDERKRAYIFVRRRLGLWNKIPNESWVELKQKMTQIFLRMSVSNLTEILSFNQRQLPWINSVLSAAELVNKLIVEEKFEEAKLKTGWLQKYNANPASVLNYELAEAVELLAKSTVAAAEQNIAVIAVSAMKDVPVDFNRHVIGRLVALLDITSKRCL